MLRCQGSWRCSLGLEDEWRCNWTYGMTTLKWKFQKELMKNEFQLSSYWHASLEHDCLTKCASVERTWKGHSYSFWTSSRCALSFTLRSPSSQVQVCRDFFWTTAFAWYPNGIWSWQVSKDGLWGMPRNIQEIQEINKPQWLIDLDLQMPRSGSQSQNRRGTMKQALQKMPEVLCCCFNHIFRAYQCHPSRNWWLYHIDSDHIDTSTQFGTFLLNIPIMMHLWFIGEALPFTWLCPGLWQSQACSKESRLVLFFFMSRRLIVPRA